MKKLTILVMCLLLVGAAALNVSAAGSASMSLSGPGTVGRGESFSVSVYLSNTNRISNGGVTLSYNSSVFEMTGGSCSAGSFGGVTAANNGGVFACDTDTVVSGTIFTFSFKVKDGADFGTYTISGTGNLVGPDGSISCSVSGTSVTVACSHSYGGVTQISGNDSYHQLTCGNCGDTKTEGHSWNSGTVTKAATCKETGTRETACTLCGYVKTETLSTTGIHTYEKYETVSATQHKRTCAVCDISDTVDHGWDAGKVTTAATCNATGVRTYTCAGCSATKTETVDKSTTHSYGSWKKDSDSQHSHTCTVCSKTETASHSWNSGTVTKEATCKETGVRTLTCTGCSATKTETVAVSSTHNYQKAARVSDSTHKHTCADCGKTETVAHTWDAGTVKKAATCSATGEMVYTCTDCDTEKSETVARSTEHNFTQWEDVDEYTHSRTCPDCGMEETQDHQAAETPLRGKELHAYVCADCGRVLSEEAHTPGPAVTNTTDQVCLDCGWVLVASIAHEHTYESWEADADGHWQSCATCGFESIVRQHDYENECDGLCDTCGYERDAAHIPGGEWLSDEEGHWYMCSVCDGRCEVIAHEPGAEADYLSAQVCTVCGYELAPIIAHEHSYSQMHYHKCDTCGLLSGEMDTTCPMCDFQQTTTTVTKTVTKNGTSIFAWVAIVLEGLVLVAMGVILLVALPGRKKKGPAPEDALQEQEAEETEA